MNISEFSLRRPVFAVVISIIIILFGAIGFPAQPKRQFTGVYNLKLARMYHYLFEQEEKIHAVVHSVDGYDEISLTKAAQIYSHEGEFILEAEDFNMKKNNESDLFGGSTLEEAKIIFVSVLSNEGTEAQTNTVIANAAIAIKCYEPNKSLIDCIEIARESLQSLKAKKSLENLLSIF